VNLDTTAASIFGFDGPQQTIDGIGKAAALEILELAVTQDGKEIRH
jgi:hypothetical protein